MNSISVVIPTYNERENITRLVVRLESILSVCNWKFEIIIVDDNSPDGTGQLVNDLALRYGNISVIHRPVRLGVASAYGEGVRITKNDVLILLDADFSHDPEAIPAMLKMLDRAPIVLASRFVSGGEFKTILSRKLGTPLLNFVVRFILGTHVKDNTNGFMLIRRQVLVEIMDKAEEKGINIFEKALYQIPILVFARRLRIPIVEVPARYRFRQFGRTKLSGWRIGVEHFFYTLMLKYKISLR